MPNPAARETPIRVGRIIDERNSPPPQECKNLRAPHIEDRAHENAPPIGNPSQPRNSRPTHDAKKNGFRLVVGRMAKGNGAKPSCPCMRFERAEPGAPGPVLKGDVRTAVGRHIDRQHRPHETEAFGRRNDDSCLAGRRVP